MVLIASPILAAVVNIFVPVGIAIGLGAILFLWGIKLRQESQTVAQIPEAPIGKTAPGPVHVRGKSTGDDLLRSPITGVPCYYYQVQVEKWVKQGDQERWEPFKKETGQRSFYLDDGSARVLVDLQNAEFDLTPTLLAEIGPKSAHYCKIDPATGLRWLSENQLHAALIADWGQARAAVQGIGGATARAADKVLAAGEKMAEWGVQATIDGVTLNPGMVGESFRFRETCLLAGQEYSVIGTCEQNPNSKDQPDAKVIRKGAATPTFLISTKSGQQLVKALQVRATVMMVAGAILALAGIAIFLVRR